MRNINGNVLVCHRVKFNDNGDAIGLEYSKVGQRIIPINHFYRHKSEDGNQMCRVITGDVWAVRQVAHKDYQFVTVAR